MDLAAICIVVAYFCSRQAKCAGHFTSRSGCCIPNTSWIRSNYLPALNYRSIPVVPNARSMSSGVARGTLFRGEGDNSVCTVVDTDRNGVPSSVYTVAKNLTMPNGVAFHEGSLYVAEMSRIINFDNIESQLANPPSPAVVYDKYPDKSHHGWKFIAFGPDGKLYVPVGAPYNVCEEKDPVFASITLNPDGGGLEIFAKGYAIQSGLRPASGYEGLWLPIMGATIWAMIFPKTSSTMHPTKRYALRLSLLCRHRPRPRIWQRKELCRLYAAGAEDGASWRRWACISIRRACSRRIQEQDLHRSTRQLEPKDSAGYRVMICPRRQ